MGYTVEAMLVYGLDLGEEEPWLNGDEDADACTEWDDVLLARSECGRHPSFAERAAYMEDRKCGCSVEFHYHYDELMYFISIDEAHISAEWGAQELISQERFTVKPEWRTQIAAFCENLGISFKDYEKTLGWHLAAFKG